MFRQAQGAVLSQPNVELVETWAWVSTFWTAAFVIEVISAGPTGFEPAIFGLTGRRVNQATPRPRGVFERLAFFAPCGLVAYDNCQWNQHTVTNDQQQGCQR